MKLTKYVKDWLERAQDDVKTIEILLKETGPARIICFHSQQAAEKYLKAFLAQHNIHIRKIHDLKALLVECIKIDNGLNSLEDAAEYLNQFYITVRYPDDAPDFSLSKAKSGYKSVLEIQKEILNRLK